MVVDYGALFSLTFNFLAAVIKNKTGKMPGELVTRRVSRTQKNRIIDYMCIYVYLFLSFYFSYVVTLLENFL